MYKRKIYSILFNRLKEDRQFIQVISGPRQVGKTTLVQQVADDLNMPVLYASADEPSIKSHLWIEQQWDLARLEASRSTSGKNIILILDEIQKIPGWSSIVKRLWDEDTRKQVPIKVVLLGSAPILMQEGLTESLAGRFEQIHATHWSFEEMHAAFKWDINTYLYFGGYPGSARLISDEDRWRYYINDSLIETTISRDILYLNKVSKPALLRRLFELACHYSGQILSYQKMTGQLQDSGNTTTLAHYLDLLSNVGMVTGLSKFAGQVVRQRGSSPKLQVYNTALISASSQFSFEAARNNPEFWGRLVESAIGAYLINSAKTHGMKIFYWRDLGREVDFILQWRNKTIAIEVKSVLSRQALPGMDVFCEKFNPDKSLVVGSQNLSVETFLKKPLAYWFDS